MDSHHNAPPYDFVFWSHVQPLVVDSATIWSESAGHAQPALNIGLDSPTWRDIGWDSAATLQNLSKDSVTPAGGRSAGGFNSIETSSAAALNTAFNYSDGHPVDFNDLNLDFPDPWLIPTPPLTGSPRASTTSSLSNALLWSEDSQSPTSMAAAQQKALVNGGPLMHNTPSLEELDWTFDSREFDIAPLQYTPVDRSGLGTSESYSTENFVDFNGSPVQDMFRAGWVSCGPRPSIPSTANRSFPNMETLPQTTVRKRRGEDDTLHCQKVSDSHQSSLHKRRKTTMETRTGILEAGGSGSRTPQMLVTRTHSGKILESKATGSRVERLTALTAQGTSKISTKGPSVPQGFMGVIGQERLPSVEGSAEESPRSAIIKTAPPQDKTIYIDKDTDAREAESDTLFYIPRGLDMRQRSLLDATSDDWARGTVRVLKCRLCPGAGFSNWEIFRRHCNTMEAHPEKISFCKYCGDFFARSDSLARHYNNRPQECRIVSPARAEMKRRETERVHSECEDRLKRWLKTNEDIGEPFAKMMKEMYPESSKRGSRQQNRLKGSRSGR